MPGKIRKTKRNETRGMDSEDLQQGSGKSGQGAPVEVPLDEKIPCDIRDRIRIRPQDFSAVKKSYEEWRATWET